MEKELESENKHLKYVQKEYSEIIGDTNLKIKNLPKFYPNNYDKMLEEKERLTKKIEVLDSSKNKPYFARIDFENKKDSIKDICYIGKIGVTNYDNEIITVDWRAPIATLYYDSNIGETSYIAPEGKIEGKLTVKRQYEIENGNLLNFIDVDTVSNDELLKPFLGVSADNRLKNIVSTIQSEQNQIIRKDLSCNSITQGVAGSGKTSVALHRTSYLVYNNRDIYSPDQYMVIGPNKFFSNYISSVLPDLDANGVIQYDFIDFAQTYLEEKMDVRNSLDILSDVVNGKKDIFSYYITSMEFRKEIDKYLEKYYETLIPNEHLYFKNFKILDANIIRETFLSINDKVHKSLKSRVDKTISILSKKIDERKNNILENILSQALSNDITKDIQSQKVKDRELLKKELNVSGNNILKSYFKSLIKTPFQIYIEILAENDKLRDNNFDLEQKQKQIKNKKMSVEDLTPLMYIQYNLFGSEEYSKYRHVVIDEAQDYNTFTFYVLKVIMYNSTFSIYGDLAQSLYSYKSIHSWEEIIVPVFDGNCEMLYLNKSYRTTIEIMNEANKINELLGYSLAVPVIRHGKDVQHCNIHLDNLYNYIINIVNTSLINGHKSIAIICKNQVSVDEVYDNLSKSIEIDKINTNNVNTTNSVCCISSYLSKGLEFDVVILLDVGKSKFDKEKVEDLKLLYVSMTRALHELYIVE